MTAQGNTYMPWPVRCRDLLEAMLDPAWWRQEVDVNGEFTTTRAKGYYDVVGDIRGALGCIGDGCPSPFRSEEPCTVCGSYDPPFVDELAVRRAR